MTPELMERFLAELEAGALPRTETTAQIAAEFTRALKGRRGRGRPKKGGGSGAWLHQRLNDKSKASGDKRTVEDLLNYLSERVLAGDTFELAKKAATVEFGRSGDGIRKAIGPYGKRYVELMVKATKQLRASPFGKAIQRLHDDIAAGRFADEIAAGRLDPKDPLRDFPDDLPRSEVPAEIDRRWPPLTRGR